MNEKLAPGVNSYGPDEQQVGELWIPNEFDDPLPLVVLIHGGFWRAPYVLDQMRPLARHLVAGGYATWNLEYRRVGCPGGGWPGTFADILLGINALGNLRGDSRFDLDRVALVGHSAGGHLALLSAAHPELFMAPSMVISLAGVCDMVTAAEDGLGEDAAVEFMGGLPRDSPDEYARASPIRQLPIGVAQLIVHGGADLRVPPSISRVYSQHALDAGDDVEFLLYPSLGHMELIDPLQPVWEDLLSRLSLALLKDQPAIR